MFFKQDIDPNVFVKFKKEQIFEKLLKLVGKILRYYNWSNNETL